MGPATPIIAAVALGVTAISTIASINASKKAAKDERRARAAQIAIEEARAKRERAQQIREARIKRAAIVASAEASGASETSAAVGGAGSVQSQLGSNLSFLDFQTSKQREVNTALNSAASNRSRANTFNAIGGLSGTIFSDAGGFKTIFKG